MKIVRSSLKFVVVCAAACAMLGAAVGCQDNPKTKESKAKVKSSDEYWASDTGVVPAIADAQAAAGAQEDASLSGAHFTGGKLNALGQHKLGLMMKGGVQPPVVYLGIADESTINVRRAAIDEYLKDSGASMDALVVKSGQNPQQGTLAVQNIARSPRVDTGGKSVSLTPGGTGPTMFGPGPTEPTGSTAVQTTGQ
jgi:hypothetical protein